ncbi:hypothetical protein CEXT_248631 [Caerostris extrusa]|uniref:Uncharacterized protein n=1 Tax=Caerostris extrusa TaxID=172846 RepID=A0AAV4U180_CAEEX|nr:hypothetical protein CEXT_248631 [Caerostris extrusa]
MREKYCCQSAQNSNYGSHVHHYQLGNRFLMALLPGLHFAAQGIKQIKIDCTYTTFRFDPLKCTAFGNKSMSCDDEEEPSRAERLLHLIESLNDDSYSSLQLKVNQYEIIFDGIDRSHGQSHNLPNPIYPSHNLQTGDE